MYYDILKASKVKAEVFPDYWTLLWGRKMSASMIKTITGVLPLTFTAKGGTAVDWVIEGNDDNGTENLFDYSQGCDWASGSNGASYQKIIAQQGDVFTVTSSSALYALVRGYDANDAIISGSAWSTGGKSTYTAPASIAYVKVVFRNFEYSTITAEQKATINESMLVKGSTAPDHYIPYQQGVGERTENLFDIGTSASDYVGASIGVEIDGYNLSMNVVRAGGTWTYRNKKILTTGEHTVSLSSDKTYPRVYIALRNQDDSDWLTDSDASISGFTYNSYYHGWYKDNESYTTGNVVISVIIPSCLYWQIGFGFNSIANVGTIGTLSNIMLVKGSTAPDHYIPYGYQIPLTISQQGQPDKTVDIYIGDTPLTEGETVSKTSTGVDIELFGGENVVSTTLYNKPAMEIKYK